MNIKKKIWNTEFKKEFQLQMGILFVRRNSFLMYQGQGLLIVL